MSSKNRTASQARKDRAALKRLQKSGTYSGKIDLRKAPTKYQLNKIKQLRSKAKSKSKQPLPPKTKTPGATIKRRRMSKRDVEKLPPKETGFKLKTYALPFLRKGRTEPEWRRFTRSQLTKFLAEYKEGNEDEAAEWREYAVEESWTFTTKTEKSDFRKDVDLYFTGRRIDEPQGGAVYQRKTKGHSKAGTKRAARKRRAK